MKQNGFTLIEMLVVVVVIAILSGLVFQMIGAGGTSSDKAKARRQLEALANAVEEYRAEYGRYPPVARLPETSRDSCRRHQADYNDSWTDEECRKKTYQPLRYDYPGPKGWWTHGGEGGSRSLAALLQNVPRSDATVFIFGLMSYLETRVEGRAENAHRTLFEKSKSIPDSQSHWLSENSRRIRKDAKSSDWNVAEDNPRDARAAKKIEPFIKDIRRTEQSVHSYRNNVYTNHQSTIWDPWGNELNYKSDPPYDSYRIWSIGPDGRSGTADDIVAGREN